MEKPLTPLSASSENQSHLDSPLNSNHSPLNSAPLPLNSTPIPTRESETDNFSIINIWKRWQRLFRHQPGLLWGLTTLASAGILFLGVFMVQRTTQLLSQAWEQLRYQDLTTYESKQNIFESDPILATMSGKLKGERCPIKDRSGDLPAGQILFFDNQAGLVYRLPVSKNQVEFSTTLLANPYYLFFQPADSLQPVQALTNGSHRPESILVEAQSEVSNLKICDSQYIAGELPPELQPMPTNIPTLSQARTDSAVEIPENMSPITEFTGEMATLHGTIFSYGSDVYPAGTVLFYELNSRALYKAAVAENTNVFSAPIPAGQYIALFEPRNPVLPKFGFTQYVKCGLNPTVCTDHSLLKMTVNENQEYGQIQLCDPQYNQAGLPTELQFINE